jgi:hypothetical protein
MASMNILLAFVFILHHLNHVVHHPEGLLFIRLVYKLPFCPEQTRVIL